MRLRVLSKHCLRDLYAPARSRINTTLRQFWFTMNNRLTCVIRILGQVCARPEKIRTTGLLLADIEGSCVCCELFWMPLRPPCERDRSSTFALALLLALHPFEIGAIRRVI